MKTKDQLPLSPEANAQASLAHRASLIQASRTLVLAVTVVVFLLLLLPGIVPGATAFTSADYFPLETGNLWTYEVDGSTFTRTVSANTTLVNGVPTKAVGENSGDSTLYFTSDSLGIRLHRLFQADVPIPGVGLVDLSLTFDPPIVLANAVTDVSETVDSNGTASNSLGSFAYSASFTVAAFENITVPDGNFDVARLEGSINVSGQVLSPTIFLAKHIGLVKSVGLAIGVSETAELAATNLSPDPPAFIAQSGTTSSVLAAGVETGGFARGPAFQLFDGAGSLLGSSLALNSDFTGITFGNNSHVLVGGRETKGLARGPAFQLFNMDGSLRTGAFVLNPDFTEVRYTLADVASPGVLVCGRETEGLARGFAFQIFNDLGGLLTGAFTLNPNFTADLQCLAADLDGLAGDEILVGGRNEVGLESAYEVWDTDGNLLSDNPVLTPDFSEVKFGVAEVASNGVVVVGRETAGLARGPAFQLFDGAGNLLAGPFVLNPDFTQVEAVAANTSNTVAGDEIVVVGTETEGAARGPAFQIWDSAGNPLAGSFVLTPDFTEIVSTKIDIDNDGVDEILIGGRETGGPTRGPAVQVWDGSGSLLFSSFVLNEDFTNLRIFPVDQDGDGDEEIGVGGVETAGGLRGPAYQIFESDGSLILGGFVLNGDF